MGSPLSSGIQLTKTANYDVFALIADYLEKEFHVIFTNKLSSADQCYWDFGYQGHSITLHLEHYTGISLFSEDMALTQMPADIGELNKLASAIKKKFQL
jgi:hypothetical protein